MVLRPLFAAPSLSPSAERLQLMPRTIVEKPEAQLKAFVAKFAPHHQTLIRSVRKALRKRMPTATDKLLQGSGNQTRFIRLENAAVLGSPEVKSLVAAALADAKPMPKSGRGELIIRSVSAKQRPRKRVSRT